MKTRAEELAEMRQDAIAAAKEQNHPALLASQNRMEKEKAFVTSNRGTAAETTVAAIEAVKNIGLPVNGIDITADTGGEFTVYGTYDPNDDADAIINFSSGNADEICDTIDDGNTFTFTRDVRRGSVTIAEKVILRPVNLTDTYPTCGAQGPTLLARCVGEITTAGGSIDSCSWQIMSSGEHNAECVWISVNGDFYEPFRERLIRSGWRSIDRSDEREIWSVGGARVTTFKAFFRD